MTTWQNCSPSRPKANAKTGKLNHVSSASSLSVANLDGRQASPSRISQKFSKMMSKNPTNKHESKQAILEHPELCVPGGAHLKDKEQQKSNFMNFLKRGFSTKSRRSVERNSSNGESALGALRCASDVHSQLSAYLALEKSENLNKTAEYMPSSIEHNLRENKERCWNAQDNLMDEDTQDHYSKYPNFYFHSTGHPPSIDGQSFRSVQLDRRPPRPINNNPKLSHRNSGVVHPHHTPNEQSTNGAPWLNGKSVNVWNPAMVVRRPRTPTLGRVALLVRASYSNLAKHEQDMRLISEALTDGTFSGTRTLDLLSNCREQTIPCGCLSRSSSVNCELREQADRINDSAFCSTQTLTKLREATPTNLNNYPQTGDDPLNHFTCNSLNDRHISRMHFHAYDTVAFDQDESAKLAPSVHLFEFRTKSNTSSDTNSKNQAMTETLTTNRSGGNTQKHMKSILFNPAFTNRISGINMLQQEYGEISSIRNINRLSLDLDQTYSDLPDADLNHVNMTKNQEQTLAKIVGQKTDSDAGDEGERLVRNQSRLPIPCKHRTTGHATHQSVIRAVIQPTVNSEVTTADQKRVETPQIATLDERKCNHVNLHEQPIEIHPALRLKSINGTGVTEPGRFKVPVGSVRMRKRAKPELENQHYRDISLRLSVQEVKNLSLKGKYFCEVCLDRTLYARTTSKHAEGDVFWGEKFEVHNLPEISIITINLYRHGPGSTKDKRQKNKEINHFVAFVTIPLADLSATSEYQQWLTMQSPQTTPYLVHLNNSSQTMSPRIPGDARCINSDHSSPNGSRLRKRSAPVGCFRTSTSSGVFSLTEDFVNGTPGTENTRQDGKKKRSWTAGIKPHGESVTRQQGTRYGAKSAAGSNNISPNYTTSGMSFSLPEDPMPQIRLSVQYEAMDILPLSYYNELRGFLKTHSLLLIQYLESHLATRKKEDLASCLVNLHEKLPELSVADLLTELILEDLRRNADETMLLRANSMASKAIECYIKLVGTEYLQHLLKAFVSRMMVSGDEEDFEIDPTRVNPCESNKSSTVSGESTQLDRNRMALLNSVNYIWKRIVSCINYIPYELREVFYTFRHVLQQTHGRKIASQVISSCLFLRFICPAIHGPVLFDLATSVPENNRISRNLTLVAKVLQTIANGTTFGEKESHMKILNEFVEKQIPVMQKFLDDVSSATLLEMDDEDQNSEDCHNFINLGYEFAKMSTLLEKYIQTHSLPNDLQQLPIILDHVRQHTSDTPFSPLKSDSSIGGSKQTSSHSTGLTAFGRPRFNSADALAANRTSTYTERHTPSSDTVEHQSPQLGISIDLNNQSTTPNTIHQITGILVGPQEACIRRASTNAHHPGCSDQPEHSPAAIYLTGNINELLVQYREQLRQLNDCIERVDPNSDTNESSLKENGANLDKRQRLLLHPYDRGMIGEASDVYSSGQSSNVYHTGSVECLDYNDYELGDTKSRTHTIVDQCQSEPLHTPLHSDIPDDQIFRQSVLSESPSLDQLADRLQELKLLLKHEREELAEVVATKTRVIKAQEQSIEQLTNELHQLRRVPGSRFQSTVNSQPPTKYSSGTISPSSSFSSEYGVSNQSDDPFVAAFPPPARHRHQKSESGVTHKSSHSHNSSFRSHSFLAKVDKSGLSNNSPRHGPNLLDLTRVSEGTGIPLGDLIGSKQPVPIRRRFSETKVFHR